MVAIFTVRCSWLQSNPLFSFIRTDWIITSGWNINKNSTCQLKCLLCTSKCKPPVHNLSRDRSFCLFLWCIDIWRTYFVLLGNPKVNHIVSFCITQFVVLTISAANMDKERYEPNLGTKQSQYLLIVNVKRLHRSNKEETSWNNDSLKCT